MDESVTPPNIPEPKKRRNGGGNNGGGTPLGHCAPIPAPHEVVVDAVVELSAGMTDQDVAMKHDLRIADVRRIQTLVGLSPQEYFNAIANRMEPVLGDVVHALGLKAKDVINGTQDASMKDLAIAVGVLTKNLSELRGNAKPASVHQTNIQINNLSRDEARKLLLGNTS